MAKLIPVEFLKDWSPYIVGTRAGFSPEAAARLVSQGAVKYVKEESVPKTNENEDSKKKNNSGRIKIENKSENK